MLPIYAYFCCSRQLIQSLAKHHLHSEKVLQVTYLYTYSRYITIFFLLSN